jgi:hypothetical protein
MEVSEGSIRRKYQTEVSDGSIRRKYQTEVWDGKYQREVSDGGAGGRIGWNYGMEVRGRLGGA